MELMEQIATGSLLFDGFCRGKIIFLAQKVCLSAYCNCKLFVQTVADIF